MFSKLMKPALAFFFWLGLLSRVLAASALVAWDPWFRGLQDEPEPIGYRLYIGTKSGSYPRMIDTGESTHVRVDHLKSGKTYYAVVRAYTPSHVELGTTREMTFTPQ